MYIYNMCSELGLVQNVQILSSSELLSGTFSMEKKVLSCMREFLVPSLNSISSENEHDNSNSSPKIGVTFTQA